MRLRFRIRTAPTAESGELVDRVVDVEPAADEVRIGRRAGVEIQLPFSTVSSVHARVFKHGEGWALLDMGSSNGTFIGTVRLAIGQPRVLKPGEIFRLADVTVGFEGEVGGASPAEDKPRSESTATLARRLVNDLFQSVAGAEIARVVVETGPSSGQSMALALPDRPYKVGRAPDCDLVLSDDDVSREHAAFERRWQGVFIRDLGSKNGVDIDGAKIRGEQRVHDGDLITLGGSQLRIDDPEERYLRQMEADAREAPRKTAPPPILTPSAAAAAPVASADATSVSGRVPPGRVSAAATQAQFVAAAAPLERSAEPRSELSDAAETPEGSGGGNADKPDKKSTVTVARPTVVSGRAQVAAPPAASARPHVSEPSRALPLFVSMFSIAVLGGVGYLVWVIFFGMGGGRP